MDTDDRLPEALYEAYMLAHGIDDPGNWERDTTFEQGAWRTVAAVAREALAPAFVYALGARVRWAGDLGHTLVVLQRRYTERPDALPPLIDYLVARDGDAAQGRQWRAHWVYAADVTPVEEGT